MFPDQFLLPGGAISRRIAKEEPDLVEVRDKCTLNYLDGLLRRRTVRSDTDRAAVARDATTPVLEPTFVSTPGNRWGAAPGLVTR